MMRARRAPTVSVGLPVYNGERFLEEAISSIVSQTYRDLELVISDNGSTDGTEEICRSFAARDTRVRFFRHDENRGAAFNFNFVLAESRGKYFKWHAHDDKCLPEFVERCVDVLDRDPSVVLSYPTPVDIDEEGIVLGPRDNGLEITSSRPHLRFAALMRRPHRCLPVFGLIRADVLKATERMGAYFSADRVLLGELSLRGKLFEVPETLFQHREHDERFAQVHRTAWDQDAWFKPPGTSSRYPLWRVFRGHFSAIRRAPVRSYEKALCLLQLARWTVNLAPKLGREILSGLRNAQTA